MWLEMTTASFPQNDQNHVYFTNRAQVRIKVEDWNGAVEDCKAAIKLKVDSVKAQVTNKAGFPTCFCPAEGGQYTGSQEIGKKKYSQILWKQLSKLRKLFILSLSHFVTVHLNLNPKWPPEGA